MIVIVEDEAGIRALLAELLEEEGYHVATASNGVEALTYLRQCAAPPQLILLDLWMPIMTGWQFRKEQLRDPDLATIPVVILSATPDLRQHATGLQVQDCLEKPIHIIALLDIVEKYASTGGRAIE
jgi:CheY-like chemotaxis protein